MGIETAFLLGVLVGQWIMFWAMWRRVSQLAQYILDQAMDLHAADYPGGAIIELPPETFRDEDRSCGLERFMETKYKLVRPATLVEGNEYLLNKRRETAAETSVVPVRFVAYCSSPAFVIVSNGNGKMRCARDDVFLLCLEKQVGYGGS